MNKATVVVAKLAGIGRAVGACLEIKGDRTARPIQNFAVSEVGHLFSGAERQISLLRQELPELFGDFAEFVVEPQQQTVGLGLDSKQEMRYSRQQLERLARDIEQVFEIRANSELAAPATTTDQKKRVFISHGRAPDWREVQAYIERDIKLSTLELAQEPNMGMTVLGKLVDAAEQCDCAVIIIRFTCYPLDSGRANPRGIEFSLLGDILQAPIRSEQELTMPAAEQWVFLDSEH